MVLLSTSPMRNSDTLWGEPMAGFSTGTVTRAVPRGWLPQLPYVLLKDTAMVSTAFSNSRLSASLLDS